MVARVISLCLLLVVAGEVYATSTPLTPHIETRVVEVGGVTTPYQKLVYKELFVGGGILPVCSRLVHEERYAAVSNYVDSRNAAGTGTVDFLAHDWQELRYWVWNRDALDDPTGALVLYNIDGYEILYTSSDDYVEHQTAREDENDRQLYRSVMLPAVFEPASRRDWRGGGNWHSHD